MKKTRKRRDPAQLLPDAARIAKRLHELRQKDNSSQGEIADVVGVTQAAVSRWESSDHPATPSAAELALLADHFEVTCDYLAGRTDDPHRLPAGQAVVDLGLLNRLLALEDKETISKILNADLSFGIYVSIPDQAEVMTHPEARKRVREVDQHLRKIDQELWQQWARHLLD